MPPDTSEVSRSLASNTFYALQVLTGLVYAAVVILWAAVLVPRWMHRHDRNATRRTTVTFHRAMATLERRRARHSASRASHNVDVVVAGARSRVHDRTRVARPTSGLPSAIDRHLDLGIDPFEGSEQDAHLRDARLARARMVAREAAARRRRQVRQGLIALSVIALVLHVMGPLPLLITALPPMGLAAFWFATRHAAARPESARGSTRVAQPGVTGPARARPSASRARGGAASRRGERDRSESNRPARRTAQRHVEPAMGAMSGAAGAAGAGAVDASSDVRLLSDAEVSTRTAAAASGQWDAVEAPLPTNIVGGRADRRPTSRGRSDWTAQRMLEQVEALRAPDRDEEAELGLDDYVEVPYSGRHEHLRAVND